MNSANQTETYYLIGGGSYDNLTTYRLVTNDQFVKLVPLEMPWSMMVATNLLFLAFFACFLYFAKLGDNPWGAYCFIVVLAIATCSLFDFVVFTRFRNSTRRGPILTFDKTTGVVCLPDRGMKFSIRENISIECLTSWQEGDGPEDSNSELNFVVSNDGNIDRFNLLRSIATLRPFGKLTKQLRQELPIPVRRI